MQSRLDIKIYLNTVTLHTLDNIDKVHLHKEVFLKKKNY